MSGFVSKISAAGSRGWTGLQSLWERDNKTQLTDPPPGPPQEKTSLLSLALPSRHPRGSRLLSEDDDWPDNPADNKATTTTDNSSSSSTTTTTTTSQSLTTPTPNPFSPSPNPFSPSPTPQSFPPSPTPQPSLTTPTPTPTTSSSPRSRPKADRPVSGAAGGVAPPVRWTSWVSEEEGEGWLDGDSAHCGILHTDKKKSTRESKRPSPRFKHKTPSSSASASSKGGDWRHGERGFSALGKLKGPSFGKLLDTEEGEGEGRGGSTSAGCENQVWTNDDDDEDDEDAQWRMIEQRAAPPKTM